MIDLNRSNHKGKLADLIYAVQLQDYTPNTDF